MTKLIHSTKEGQEQLTAERADLLVEQLTAQAYKSMNVRNKAPGLDNIKFTADGSFHIPQAMTLRQAGNALLKLAEDQETIVEFSRHIQCAVPADGLAIMWRTFLDQFNYTESRIKRSMMSEEKTGFFDITIGDERVSVPSSIFAPAGWKENENIRFIAGCKGGGQLPYVGISAEVQKKRVPELEALADRVATAVREQSNFIGKTLIFSSLEWMKRGGRSFDVISSMPAVKEFHPEPIYLNADAEIAVMAEVTHKIEGKTPISDQRGIVILTGDYGTGKSLLCSHLATHANTNNWTAVLLGRAQDIEVGLRLCNELKRPDGGVLLIVEDVDRVVSGQRTAEIDVISTLMDGVDKEAMDRTIVVLTTNNSDSISRVILRRGCMIDIQLPSRDTLISMMDEWVPDDVEVDLEKVADAAKGMTPSFVMMAVRSWRTIVGDIEDDPTETLINRINAYRPQAELVAAGDQVTPQEVQLVDLLATTLEERADNDGFADVVAERVRDML